MLRDEGYFMFVTLTSIAKTLVAKFWHTSCCKHKDYSRLMNQPSFLTFC